MSPPDGRDLARRFPIGLHPSPPRSPGPIKDPPCNLNSAFPQEEGFWFGPKFVIVICSQSLSRRESSSATIIWDSWRLIKPFVTAARLHKLRVPRASARRSNCGGMSQLTYVSVKDPQSRPCSREAPPVCEVHRGSHGLTAYGSD